METAAPAARTAGVSSSSRLRKEFGDVAAVDGIVLRIEPGEFFSLLGPSGCGKTTTLRMIAGFEQPTGGRSSSTAPTSWHAAAHAARSTPFPVYALFPHLDLEDNVAYGLRWRRGVDKAERRAAGRRGARAGSPRRPRAAPPAQLSGGQQQRVALAGRWCCAPKVLLLDEPLGALDAKLRKDLQVDLAALQPEVGITFVYVTHDQEEALTMSRPPRRDGRRPGGPGRHSHRGLRAAGDGVRRRLPRRGQPPRRRRGDGTGRPAQVRLGDFTLDAAGDGPAGPVKLVIRPERVPWRRASRAGPNCVPAMVERVVYVGATTQVHVRLPGGEAIQALPQTTTVARSGPPGPRSASPCRRTPCPRCPPDRSVVWNSTASGRFQTTVGRGGARTARRDRRDPGRSPRNRGARRTSSPGGWRCRHRGGPPTGGVAVGPRGGVDQPAAETKALGPRE